MNYKKRFKALSMKERVKNLINGYNSITGAIYLSSGIF